MADINEPMTSEQRTLGLEAKRMIESDAMKAVFFELQAAYITSWQTSDIGSNGEQLPMDQASARRGMLWVKVKCLEDLQFELQAYADRAEFAENGGNS